MKKQLSGTAKSFKPVGAAPVRHSKFVIISWNVLSEELTEAVYNSISPNGTPLFSKTFQGHRIDFLKQKLEYFIRKYKHPVFCLQEVNDSHDKHKNLGLILSDLLKSHHYRVLYQSFGTFDPVYPELGLLTAIPVQHFEILDVVIKQIVPELPNFLISVSITPRHALQVYEIVNTHFPAKFYDKKVMRTLSETFQSLLMYSPDPKRRLIICGDFNTTTGDSWYGTLKGWWNDVPPVDANAISTISTQRRDKRSRTNQVFQGRIDHIFFQGTGLTVSLLDPLPVMAEEESSVQILPSNQVPSDHVPLVVSVSATE